MYGEGEGVAQDNIRAHMWFSLAAISENTTAMEGRDIIESRMTPQEIVQAEQLVKEYFKQRLNKHDLFGSKSDNDFDLPNLDKVEFLPANSLFEIILKKRIDFPHLFVHMPIPTAEDLADARLKAVEFSEEKSKQHVELFSTFMDVLKTENIRFEPLIDSFREYLDGTDDVRIELLAVGGSACDDKLIQIAKLRDGLFGVINKISEDFLGDVGKKSINGIRETYDNYYESVKQIPMRYQSKFIDTQELPSFILTLSDADFKEALTGILNVDSLITYLSDSGILKSLNPVQKEQVTQKLALLHEP